MKVKFIILLGLSTLMISCKKITHVTLVEPSKPGTLSYQLIDDLGRGLSGVKISLYSAMIKGGDAGAFITPIELSRTDREGFVNFANLLPGNYRVVSDSAMVNGIIYPTSEYVQVISNLEKKKTVKASDFSGTLKIKLLSNSEPKYPLKNMVLIAYPHVGPEWSNPRSLVESARLKGITDENGLAEIKVPCNFQYGVIIYNPQNDAVADRSGNYRVDQGGQTNTTVYY
ncbi:hypothetical protein B0I27_105248 [Arcticibacter pallidicorallinus]|uniref:Carboxypeptidase family protein n=1 Tax=Arcticibacter pallidicorallinus TaxID=1259464 RepID=A0A2T0U4C5_9SPHI|nr:hypothetical protein [Arcticibacter pallidicorallinus]PRY52779.1 hypothetical protein B0I27_105248 [Arcticibacter pallidicorallinus]